MRHSCTHIRFPVHTSAFLQLSTLSTQETHPIDQLVQKDADIVEPVRMVHTKGMLPQIQRHHRTPPVGQRIPCSLRNFQLELFAPTIRRPLLGPPRQPDPARAKHAMCRRFDLFCKSSATTRQPASSDIKHTLSTAGAQNIDNARPWTPKPTSHPQGAVASGLNHEQETRFSRATPNQPAVDACATRIKTTSENSNKSGVPSRGL